jgi:CRP/FNR family transcriptional regulator, nitrogen oxide reductase regulator
MPAPGVARLSANPNSRLFDGLSPRDLKVILGEAKQTHFLANSVVVNQGHRADQLFFLRTGRARYFFNTEDGRKVVLSWLTPGEIFGGATILSEPSSYLVSTETLKDSWVVVWDRVTIRSLAARFPRLMENALLIASNYLAWYLASHIALITHSARQRLARVLICLAETIGERVAEGFEFDATNEELASAANVTPFTASRLLSEWQRNRAIVKARGKIRLRSPDRLFLHTV